MTQPTITPAQLRAYRQHLADSEASPATIDKYLRDLRQFAHWLGARPLDKTPTTAWKTHLQQTTYQPSTINCKLSALDRYLTYIDRPDCKVTHLRRQRPLFRDDIHELTLQDYHTLIHTAHHLDRPRTALLIETLGATGIRVSELAAITCEAAAERRALIHLKGKIRTILIPDRLADKLLHHAAQRHITTGPIFCTSTGRPLDRKQIWREMKDLAPHAGIPPEKIHPHNLRHLFARAFYEASHDIAKLADILGHSSLETTRIYLLTTSAEHARTLDQLPLII